MEYHPSISRIIWADLLRIFAIFAVICQHYCPAYYGSHLLATNILVTICDWCIPVFVMLSGMFSLSPDKQFPFQKRLLRLVVALCFWSIVYGINYFVIQNHSSYTITSIIQPIFWKRLPWYHLWFVYMLLGLYLLTPVIRSWIEHASKQNILYFLLLCFAFNCVTWINQFLPSPLHHLLPALSAFVGYYVLGYYLSTLTITKQHRIIIYIASIAACAGIAISNQLLKLTAHTLIVNENPLTAIMSIGVFVAFKNIHFNTKWNNFSRISLLVFGIYLVHDLFIQYLHINLFSDIIPLNIFINALSNLIISAFIIFLIRKVPFVGKLIT